MEIAMKNCNQCGQPLNDGDAFCQNCGQAADATQPATSTTTTPTHLPLPLAAVSSGRAATPGRLVIASISVLSLLFGFLAAIVLLALYSANWVSGPVVVIGSIILNIGLWLGGPYITDWINRIMYKVKFLSREELKQTYPDLEQFIAEVTLRQNIPFPRIGYIDDDNPTAFTYGSAAYNARVILTKGLWTYLSPEELDAVVAHELGHIVHRDFIIMAIANTVLQILYEIYYITLHGRRSSNDSKGGSYLAVIGILAYIFYQIGFYMVLFLSRLRESYADEFAANVTGQPSLLSGALVKIAYGIVAKDEGDESSSTRLLQSTRTLGIMGFRTAQQTGAIAKATNLDGAKIGRALLYDLVSPWAKLAELASTHPLTGKRLLRLDRIAQAMGITPIFDMDRIRQTEAVDNGRLWRGFVVGVMIGYLPVILLINTLIAGAVGFLLAVTGVPNVVMIAAGLWLVLLGVGLIVRMFYRYSGGTAQDSDVLTLMSDLYASPVRGRPVAMAGTAVGKGQAGFIFAEDIIMQDKTGIVYIDYTSFWGLIGNMFFAWKKVKQIIGQSINVQGWFFRSNTQRVVLKNIDWNGTKIKSYARFWTFLGSAVIAIAAIGFGLALFAGSIVGG